MNRRGTKILNKEHPQEVFKDEMVVKLDIKIALFKYKAISFFHT